MRRNRIVGLGNIHDTTDAVRTMLTKEEIEHHMKKYFSNEELMNKYSDFPEYLGEADNTTGRLRNFNSRDIPDMVLYPL